MKISEIKLRFKQIGWLLVFWIMMYKFMVKSDLIETIQEALPSREAGLLAGMVWGDKGGISMEMNNLLKNSGLIHIVVVSGTNLMIIGRSLIEKMARFVGRKMAIIGGGGIILIYVNLVGWQIPVVRATLFLGVYYWGQMLGRQFKSERALLLVALMMILADVSVLKEISFWLSMAAFGAILLNRRRGIIKSTIWVSLFVWPILSISFGKITLLTPITNLGVLFLVELITMMGFVGSLVGLLCQGLGKIILVVCYPMLRYLIEIVENVGNWKWGIINFQFNWWLLIGWYLLIGAYWYGKKKV